MPSLVYTAWGGGSEGGEELEDEEGEMLFGDEEGFVDDGEVLSEEEEGEIDCPEVGESDSGVSQGRKSPAAWPSRSPPGRPSSPPGRPSRAPRWPSPPPATPSGGNIWCSLRSGVSSIISQWIKRKYYDN